MIYSVVFYINDFDNIIHRFFQQVIGIDDNIIEHIDLGQFLFGGFNAQLKIFRGFGIARF